MALAISKEKAFDLSAELAKEYEDKYYTKWVQHRDANWVPGWNKWFKNFMNAFYGSDEDKNYQGEAEAGRSKIFIGATKNKVTSVANKLKDFLLTSGEPPVQTKPSPRSKMPIDQARERAKKMETLIKDQFIESAYIDNWFEAIMVAAIFGTVVGKKNIITQEERYFEEYLPLGGLIAALPGAERFWKVFSQFGRYREQVEPKKLPVLEPWDLYLFVIDPKAKGPQEGRGAYFDEFLSRHAVQMLKDNSAYMSELLERVLEKEEPEDNKYAGAKRDKALGEGTALTVPGYRFSEYWGLIEKEWFKKFKIDLIDDSPSDFTEGSITFANNGDSTWVVRLYENKKDGPFAGKRPIERCQYELVPKQFYGRGIPQCMEGEQFALNSTMRLYLDNKGLRANPPMLVDSDYGRDIPNSYSLAQIIELQGVNGQWEKAFKMVEFPDIGASLEPVMNIIMEFIDQATVPRYNTGYEQNPHRTSSGLSMILGTANVNIKAFVHNFDIQWIEPDLRFKYWFNMRYHPDQQVKGDFNCVALGVRSLMSKDVHLQNFMQFLQVLGGSLITPLVQQDVELLLTLFVQLCEGMELNELKDLAEERVKKLEAAKARGAMAPPGPPAQGPGSAEGGPGPSGPGPPGGPPLRAVAPRQSGNPIPEAPAPTTG